ncbi:hypothetical protein HCC18_13080 [Listeria booriae]|uniref:hypothetical protein n=1 Tax=Listeria booriae TaxID=1552123 RepID=UPI001625628F|nr:hypothetical protein [Listeria booriae]MBC2317773.1 hypothetical protein [Listeria booriae]
MPVEGLVRDFTDTAKEHIKGVVKQKDSSASLGGWGNQDFSLLPGPQYTLLAPPLKIQDYIHDIDAYHKAVLSDSFLMISTIDTVFEDVKTVDSNFGKGFQDLHDQLTQIEKTMKEFVSLFGTEEGSRYLSSSSMIFSEKLQGAGSGIVTYYLNKLVEVDENGEKIYKWDAIHELLMKDEADMTNEEYLALISLVQQMNTKDSEGNIVPDYDNLNRFAQEGYILTDRVSNPTPENMIGAYTVATVTFETSPVFKNFAELYSHMTSELITRNGSIFNYQGDPTGKNGQGNEDYNLFKQGQRELNNEIFKGSFFQFLLAHGSSVEQTVFNGDNPSKPWIFLTHNKDDLGVTVTMEGTARPVVIYPFAADNSYVFNKQQGTIAVTFERDKDSEFLSALGEKGLATIMSASLSKYPVIGAIYETLKFTSDTYLRNLEIDANNENVKAILTSIERERLFNNLSVGSSLTSYGNSMDINYAKINQSDLQISINAYNFETGSSVNLSTISSQADQLFSSGNKGNELSDYLKWRDSNDNFVNTYKDALENYLAQTDIDKNNVSALSVEEVNEVSKMYSEDITNQ